MNDTDNLLREILAAYKSQQLRAIRETFFSDEGFACPLVALALHRCMVSKTDPKLSLERAENPAFDWACQEFGEEWTFGFLDGFDGKPSKHTGLLSIDGFNLGQQAASLLFSDGL